MSDTPRTDAAILDEHDPVEAVGTLCHQLERELTAANERVRRLQHAGDDLLNDNKAPQNINRWFGARNDPL